MTKEFVLQLVENSGSSIFTKEDVIKLINSVEGGRVISVNDIQRAIDRVVSWAEDNTTDVVDYDRIELEIGCDNRLEVSHVPIESDNLREALENNFMDFGEADDLVELERSNDEERDDE